MSNRAFRVALVGEPNAGKSSLFNALAGMSAAIVSPVPGTTRDYVTRTVTVQGTNIELIDTAGWHAATDDIERASAEPRPRASRQADLVVWCVEAHTNGERSGVSPPMLSQSIVVITKSDLAEIDSEHPTTSAKTGHGITDLRRLLAEQGEVGPCPSTRPEPEPLPASRRQRADASAGRTSVVLFDEPAELLALELRLALDQLGEMVGAVYTDDLLDRIFSRFCIGK